MHGGQEAKQQTRGRNHDVEAAIADLKVHTFNNVILMTGVIYTAWFFLGTGDLSWEIVKRLFPVTIGLVITCVVSRSLLSRWPAAARTIWVTWLSAIIGGAVWATRLPETASLYAFLPLMAAVTAGTVASLLTEGLVIVLISWLIPRLGLSVPLGLSGTYIILGGALGALLGWTLTRPLLTSVEWYVSSFAMAEAKMEEARGHRARIARVLKDLDQAYSRLKRSNGMLVLARAEAEDARAARDRFVLAVSHELRTPLNFIVGFSELMTSSPEVYAEVDQWPPGLYEDVQQINRSSGHLERLVTDVLDLGQAQLLRPALRKEWVDPARIVRDVEAMVEPAFTGKGLRFRTEIESDLPRVFIDLTRIRQVLLNLVSNGLRLTERGGLTVSLGRQNDALHFCVEDTGPGIPVAEIPKVFEEFWQLNSSTWQREEGSGLGIPISKRFVEQHGGRMWLESQVGVGTRFFFSLPLARATSESFSCDETQSPAERYWDRARIRAEGQRKVLILSCDPDAAETVGQYVPDYGVVAVANADEVSPKVNDLLPAAMIIDEATFPGDQVERVLTGLPYDLPAMILGFPVTSDAAYDLPPGVSGYLVKPVSPGLLVESVQALGPGIRRVLVVDDDPAMLRFTARALGSAKNRLGPEHNYDLMFASSASEALVRVQQAKPDAMLLDLALPDASGWDVLANLQNMPDLASIAVILVTAQDRPRRPAIGDMEVLRVITHHPLAREEIITVLQCLLKTIRPQYPLGRGERVSSAGVSE